MLTVTNSLIIIKLFNIEIFLHKEYRERVRERKKERKNENKKERKKESHGKVLPSFALRQKS